MKWFKNLSSKSKLMFSFGSIWLLVVLIIAAAYWSIAGLVENEKEFFNYSAQRALKLQEMTTAQHFVRGEYLELMLSESPERSRELRASIQRRLQQAEQIEETLHALDRHNLYEKEFNLLHEAKNAYNQTRLKINKLLDQNDLKQARILTLTEARERFQRLRAVVADMRKKEHARSETILKDDIAEADRVLTFIVILGVVTFALGLLMALLLNSTVARPLGEMAAVAAKVAEGDLTLNLKECERNDEVGILFQSFNEMIRSLRRSTSEIAAAINQLGSAAGEIMTATAQVASGTSETAAAISETTSTVEEVRQAAQLSSRKADDVSTSTKGVADISQDGKKAVDQTAEGMQRIRKEMESIAKTIVFLSEQSQSIGGIIATVTDLADQSNLLAVNAAIEAAKAGDQGKGFAVVAQEIKDLAEQSKQSTTQIRTILNDIQKATSSAVMATEQGSKAVEEGVEQSKRAGEGILALTNSTIEAANAATQISVSSRQQMVGMDQVGEAMENINQASSETAASMKQVEVAAQDINRLGQNLKRLAERYQI